MEAHIRKIVCEPVLNEANEAKINLKEKDELDVDTIMVVEKGALSRSFRASFRPFVFNFLLFWYCVRAIGELFIPWN